MRKVLRIRFLATALCMIFSIGALFAQNREITVNVDNATVKEVLKSIEAQTSYRFSFREDALANQPRVTIHMAAAPMEKVLAAALKDTGLSYNIISDKTIVISDNRDRANANAPRVLMEGTVYDSDNEPAPGATVRVPGTSIATSTDLDGHFAIEAPEGSSIEISYIGYQSQTVKPVGGKPVAVTLATDAALLDEVVVVGYGSMKKSDLTGSVTALQGADVAARRSTQLSTALQGSLSGVNITRDNSAPGATASINIRGITTISDSNPLVIIDGVPGDINNINPDDVESISVLKDAASASIYGARAAAGVIIVTTRRATDGKLSLSYNFEYGWEKPTTLPKYASAQRYLEMTNETRYNDNPAGGWYQTYSEDQVKNWMTYNKTNPDEYPVVDWQKELIKSTAPRYTHTIGISGGNDKVRSNASLRFDKTDGLYVNKEYSRFMARVNSDFIINKYIQAHLDINFSRAKSLSPNFNPMGAAERKMPPIYAVRWSDGRWGDVKNGENLLAKMTDGGEITSYDQRAGGKLGIDITPIEGLRISGVVAPNWRNVDTKTFVKQVPYTYANDPNTIVGYMGGCTTTNLREDRNKDYDITTQFFANYAKDFGQHGLTVMLGYEDYFASWDTMFASRDQYELTNYPYLDLGSQNFRDNGGNAEEYAYHSFFGRVTYNYADRYLVQFNMRRDGSSRFAKESRWANFPSVSAGWVISQEKFFKNAGMDWWTFLKLRGSWGRLGNERIGSYYPYQASIDFGTVLFPKGTGVISSTSAAQYVYAVRNISWETTESYDIGLDANFFNNRLRFVFDYYDKTTKDMLLTRDIPGYMGYENPDVNAGDMHTHGYDIELSWSDRVGDFSYTVNANFSDFISKMGNLNGTRFLGDQVKFEGSEFNEWYGYVSDGLFLSQTDLDNSPKLNSNIKVGDIKYLDISGPDGVPDGKISPEYDRVLLGGSLPRYMFGFGFNGQYKGFDLGVQFQGVGSQNCRMSPAMIEGLADNWSSFPELLDGNYWSVNNTDAQNAAAKYPRLTRSNRDANMAMSDYWLFNGRYIRMKNLTVGYTLPQALTRRAHIESVRVYVAGNDLFSISNFPKGWDPEVGATGYPICREFLIGASVKF